MTKQSECDDHQAASVRQIREAFPQTSQELRAAGVPSSVIRAGLAKLRRS